MRDDRAGQSAEPLSASAMSVARVAQERAVKMLNDVILRDALITDLQARVADLESQLQAARAEQLPREG